MFQLTISRSNSGQLRGIIHLSVPKVYSGGLTNRNTIVFLEQFNESLGKLCVALLEIGFECDLQVASLLRVDIFRDIDLQYPYAEYIPVIERLRVPHLPWWQDKTGSSQYWGRKGQPHQLTCYCKSKKEKEDYWKEYGRHIEFFGDILRCEYRMLKPDKIRQVLGMETVRNLMDGWDKLPSVFNDVLRETLYRYDPSEFEACRTSVIDADEIFRIYRESGDRNWLLYLRRSCGDILLADLLGSKAYEDAVRGYAGYKQKGIVSKQLEEAERLLGRRLRGRKSGKEAASLYTELRDKLILEGKDLEDRQFFDFMFS